MAKLTFVLEDGQEVEVLLTEHMTLGRADDNDVVVDDDRVSKRHAELVRNADGSLQVFDSNSTAGTFVNGERVRSQTILHGDRLSFGPLTAVLDLTEYETNGSTATPEPAGDKTQALTFDTPVKADKIATRKKGKGGRREFRANQQTTLPSEELLARQQAEHAETIARQTLEKTRLLAELESIQNDLKSWQERSETERAMHHARVETLRADEERLAPLKTAAQEAEAVHEEWLKSIQNLATQHEEKTAMLERLTAQHQQKTADLQRLSDDDAAARHELEGLPTHRDQALAHLQQLRAESVHDENTLGDLRRQIAELETRSHHSKEIAEVREDQLKAAEKKLEQLSQQRVQIEAHIHELSGAEEKLVQITARCREAESQHTALTAAIAALGLDQQRAANSVKELQAQITTLQESHQQAVRTNGETLASLKHTEESLRHAQEELTTYEKNITARKADLATETQRLEEAQSRRTELDRQCQELADTGQKLAGVKSQLAATEQQLAETMTASTAAEAKIAEQTATMKSLAADESTAKGRIEVLHARENDLRAELTQLGVAERSHRERFEEVRQLAAEAEKEHTAQLQRQTTSLETARRDLTDILSKLQPLRDWKEAMDLLYSRLATLPQDSPEARHLWHEIEKEKAGLHELIVTARTQAHGEMPATARGNTSATAISNAANARGTRAGGALASGSAQETTLRSRLNHLRESVQREESRLEQLRLERTRHETPHRSNPAAEAMMREQSRHLETKIRQDQERHQALLRNIELSQAEEDKRRDRLSDLEHKLAELRTAVIEAERHRSELRQQADLAHTELKNYESAIDRVTKKTAD